MIGRLALAATLAGLLPAGVALAQVTPGTAPGMPGTPPGMPGTQPGTPALPTPLTVPTPLPIATPLPLPTAPAPAPSPRRSALPTFAPLPGTSAGPIP